MKTVDGGGLYIVERGGKQYYERKLIIGGIEQTHRYPVAVVKITPVKKFIEIMNREEEYMKRDIEAIRRGRDCDERIGYE